RKLNVGAVLEGGVRKADQKVRITAQLVNTVTGYQLWSQTFDRDLGDILSLQTEIAAHVASALRVVLLGQETQRLTDGGTENPEAFDYFLRARKAYREDLEQDSLQSARSLFDHAIDSDPEYALAWAHRAEVLALLAAYWSGNDTQERDELQRLALASANRAIEIAPTSGQAYASLATVLSFAGLDFIAIEAAYRRGIHFEPGNASLLLDYARLAADLGRPEALATASRAVTLNPLNPTAHSGKGGVLLYLRRFDEARAAFDEALRLRDDGIARNWRGVVEIASGRPAAALPYCEKDKHAWFGQYCLAIAYQQLGRTSEAAAMLKQLHSENGDSLAYQYAQIHAQWGRKAEALKWLATAAELRDSGLSDVKVDPLLDPIRKDPAFGRIVTSLGFPE
ncbi:MAG TPA: tetratricopeptide repeat protein, partial [Steroidobacteraceae bacterium]|nr:tetratricopeptide repeat protein [Steroidobacteraceae bacterium]